MTDKPGGNGEGEIGRLGVMVTGVMTRRILMVSVTFGTREGAYGMRSMLDLSSLNRTGTNIIGS